MFTKTGETHINYHYKQLKKKQIKTNEPKAVTALEEGGFIVHRLSVLTWGVGPFYYLLRVLFKIVGKGGRNMFGRRRRRRKKKEKERGEGGKTKALPPSKDPAIQITILLCINIDLTFQSDRGTTNGLVCWKKKLSNFNILCCFVGEGALLVRIVRVHNTHSNACFGKKAYSLGLPQSCSKGFAAFSII